MTRAPFLLLSVIQCVPHSLPLPRQSVILNSVTVANQFNALHLCDSYMVDSQDKTERTCALRNASVTATTATNNPTSCLCHSRW